MRNVCFAERWRILECQSLHEEGVELRQLLDGSSNHAGGLREQRQAVVRTRAERKPHVCAATAAATAAAVLLPLTISLALAMAGSSCTDVSLVGSAAPAMAAAARASTIAAHILISRVLLFFYFFATSF